MAGTERFDQAATTWDLEERRVAMAHAVAEAIAKRAHLSKEHAVLDFGSGTGLITLALGPRVGSITGADTSPGMLKALVNKAEAQRLAVRVITLDPNGVPDLGGPYHVIVSSMTLHHIADVPALFRQFAAQLHPGGQVALADLDAEDGSFHEDATGVHHRGFPREQIQVWLADSGFQEIRVETATITQKGGQYYSVFLATARKNTRKET